MNRRHGPRAGAVLPVRSARARQRSKRIIRHFSHTPDLVIGIDAGSTTVKAVAADPVSGDVLWKEYQRHETRQQEACLSFLERIEQAFPRISTGQMRVFVTGSGGQAVAEHIGGRYIQEVNAVVSAVDALFPDAGSVVELGGQDAKIVVFRPGPDGTGKRKIATMNDKCAGGTGAVLDKLISKLGISATQLRDMPYSGVRVHPVAGKCGVFAETDINSLQKQGVSSPELIASLFDAIVLQNLSVLTRGHTLLPRVLLLGGPNYFVRGLQQCWREKIAAMWRERGVVVPADQPIEGLICVPEDAHYFGALGAVRFGMGEIERNPLTGRYSGLGGFRTYIEQGRVDEKRVAGTRAPACDKEELAAFRERYAPTSWHAPRWKPGTRVDAYLGLDAGSTSTKGVVLGRNRRVLAKSYRLSQGNPVEDTQAVLRSLREQVEAGGAELHVCAVGVTGYAKDILKDIIAADTALVETVAHAESGLHYFPHADVICDVGGQDIKVLILKNGAVKDFRLNTQCSAGNGYYLQATAESFGYRVEDYAEAAFTAEVMPRFSHGCAVFLQSDIVAFQRQGWAPHEILAGLAAVLPRNVWLYVCRMPNLPLLGRTFILQGGTQRNLAAVKAQVDFIRSRFRSSGIVPDVVVHPHCGEAGAIGCAFEAQRVHEVSGEATSFVGFDALAQIRVATRRDESTRCSFCANRCMRTFLDVSGPDHRRLIIAPCEKGSAQNLEHMRAIDARLHAARESNPNLVDIGARTVFNRVDVQRVAAKPTRGPWHALGGRFTASKRLLAEGRSQIRIGIPRVLGLYGTAPFFLGYFQSLGVPYENIIWSGPTTESLYREGSKRGCIDPCFPSKLAIPHIESLLNHGVDTDEPLTHIFFPMINTLPTWLDGVLRSYGCPTAVGTPEAAYAAFTKETDVFSGRGIVFKKTFVNLGDPLLCARQMHEDWAPEVGVTEEESLHAVEQGMRALRTYLAGLREQGRAVIDRIEREGRLGIVLLARPYVNDPGINHGICEEFQKLGYPVLTPDSLPHDRDLLERLFDSGAGCADSPLSISDVWKHAFAENASRKLWAAKFVARHPNLIALEISNFKCGHDAPLYSVIEGIIECSGKPHFYFRDIDENRPQGSINLRIETIVHFLRRMEQRMGGAPAARRNTDASAEPESVAAG